MCSLKNYFDTPVPDKFLDLETNVKCKIKFFSLRPHKKKKKL